MSHGLSIVEYKEKFSDVILWSDDLKKKHSDYARNVRDNTVYIGLKQTNETKRKKSVALTGIKRSSLTKERMRRSKKLFWNSVEGKLLASSIGSRKKPSNRYSESMKRRWRDPEKGYIMLLGLKKGLLAYNGMNKPEAILFDLLNILYDGVYKYNGTGEVGTICGYFPDFVGGVKLIEMYGCYYHGCQLCYPKNYTFFMGGTSDLVRVRDSKRKNALIESGYRVLEIFEHELVDLASLKNKIINFHTEEL
jgi:G:T-mismatch repair DNA endonuclease (very short patch repair protein)